MELWHLYIQNHLTFKDVVKQNPLIGVITIKVRSIAWDSIYEKFRNITALEKNKSSSILQLKNKKDCENLNSKNILLYCCYLMIVKML